MSVITRSELYSLVWSTYMRELSTELNVKATDIPKLCVANNVPRPISGYWSMVKFNKQPPQPPLVGPDTTIDLSRWLIKPKGFNMVS